MEKEDYQTYFSCEMSAGNKTTNEADNSRFRQGLTLVDMGKFLMSRTVIQFVAEEL